MAMEKTPSAEDRELLVALVMAHAVIKREANFSGSEYLQDIADELSGVINKS